VQAGRAVETAASFRFSGLVFSVSSWRKQRAAGLVGPGGATAVELPDGQGQQSDVDVGVGGVALVKDPRRRAKRSWRMTRWVPAIAALLLVLAYGGVLVWFRLNEDRMVFHPQRGKLAEAPAHLALDSRDVRLRAADSVGLVARLIPPPPAVPADAAGWILYFHGSSANVASLGYNEAWAKFRRMGLGVLAVDYRGYGESEGSPSEAGLYRDADAAYAYLTGELRVPVSRVIIYGFSLGSAVAVDLAARVRAAGLILEGALLSVPARGAELYPFLPAAWIARNRFAAVDKIARVSMPKLIIHAREDLDIPIHHGRRLFELSAPPRTFQEVGGGHSTAHQVDPAYFTAVARFVTGLGLPLAAPGIMPP
jgi:uncharacterized protein